MKICPSTRRDFQSKFECFGVFLKLKDVVIAYGLTATPVDGFAHKVPAEKFLFQFRSCVASMSEWESKPEFGSQAADLLKEALTLVDNA